MEMDFAQLRVVALLLLAMAAGLFGYSFGWERGQIDAKRDSDRQIQAVQERLARQPATLEQPAALPSGTARPSPVQPPA